MQKIEEAPLNRLFLRGGAYLICSIIPFSIPDAMEGVFTRVVMGEGA